MLIDLLNIMNNDANASDIENQMVTNNMRINLKHKQSSAKISDNGDSTQLRICPAIKPIPYK